jgi:hypothetical protein
LLSPDFKISAFSGLLKIIAKLRFSLQILIFTTPDDLGVFRQKLPVQITKALLYQLSYVGVSGTVEETRPAGESKPLLPPPG